MSDFVTANPDWYVVTPDQPPLPVLAWAAVSPAGPLRALVPPRQPGDPAVVQGVYEYHPEWSTAAWSPAGDEAHVRHAAAQDTT